MATAFADNIPDKWDRDRDDDGIADKYDDDWDNDGIKNKWDKVQISTMPSRLFLIVSGRRMFDRPVASDACCCRLDNCARRPTYHGKCSGPVDHPKAKLKAQI